MANTQRFFRELMAQGKHMLVNPNLRELFEMYAD